MKSIEEKFRGLGVDNAPGQEVRRGGEASAVIAIGENLEGPAVDFSHGDVDEDAFVPTPGSLELFVAGFEEGGKVAYTEYRGAASIREQVAARLSNFVGRPVSAEQELIITPGTQSALFLAIAATVTAGDKVAIVQPDYFANRKLVEFADAEVVPVRMDYLSTTQGAGLDLSQLEAAFRSGVKTFLFSNPSNPVGVIYSKAEIDAIAKLANAHDVTVIADQLYSRQLFPGGTYTHMCASGINPDRILTIMGPSKTESLSGFRLGVAFGAAHLVERMEKVQAIVSLRAPGYCQAVLQTWFAEPKGWMEDRIARHRAIRDDLLGIFRKVEGMVVRTPEAGSYLFLRLPALAVPLIAFVDLLRKQAGVTVTPGTEFSPQATDSIRLNFSQNHERAVSAAHRIAAMVGRYRTKA